jgi:hypothetical protein
MIPYTAPQLSRSTFNCPHCNAYAFQQWSAVLYTVGRSPGYPHLKNFAISFCDHCKEPTVWFQEAIIYPDVVTAPLPNPDLDPDIQTDYMEARSIVNKSPRGAAALLRLCIQKLCVQLGTTEKDLNQAIGSLVAKGLSPRIQMALDTVRVLGNESVHPGEMDIRDDRETANALFELVNRIAFDQLTHPKELDALYQKLPESKVKGIENRDKKS